MLFGTRTSKESCECCKESILWRMVPLTYLIIGLFSEGTWANARLGTGAPDRRLREFEQHGRLGMCFFVTGERVLLPSWQLMWASRRLASEARLILSQVVDKAGRIEALLPLAAAVKYGLTIAGESISGLLRKRATANPFTRASCYSWNSRGHTGTTVWQKKSGAYHTSFNHQRSTKSPSQTQNCM